MGNVDISIAGHIATITFSNPPHNALPAEVLASLAETITLAGADDSVHVVILQSGGDSTFCAGASFDELMAVEDFDGGKHFFMGFANVINACRKCPKFILGRVQGKAVGGGVGLAAASDYCFATNAASVKLSELALGIGPFVIGPAVQRKIGVSAFSQLAINASTWYSAGWAFEYGLYANISESVKEMDDQIAALANTLAAQSLPAMRELKQIFWEDCADWDTLLAERAAASGRLVLSDYTRQAIEKLRRRSR